MTPLTWLTIFYQAACRQYHIHSVGGRQKDSVLESSSCSLRLDGGNTEEEVEHVSESSSGELVGTEKLNNLSCGCSECFLHIPQYSQRAYLQIVRVSIQSFFFLFF